MVTGPQPEVVTAEAGVEASVVLTTHGALETAATEEKRGDEAVVVAPPAPPDEDAADAAVSKILQELSLGTNTPVSPVSVSELAVSKILSEVRATASPKAPLVNPAEEPLMVVEESKQETAGDDVSEADAAVNAILGDLRAAGSLKGVHLRCASASGHSCYATASPFNPAALQMLKPSLRLGVFVL